MLEPSNMICPRCGKCDLRWLGDLSDEYDLKCINCNTYWKLSTVRKRDVPDINVGELAKDTNVRSNADRIRNLSDEELAVWHEQYCPNRDDIDKACQKESCERGGEMITLTDHEAECLQSFIEMNLVPSIQNPELDIDSLWWIETIIKVWRKCGGKYADEDRRIEHGGDD